jgi:hypothetical protein
MRRYAPYPPYIAGQYVANNRRTLLAFAPLKLTYGGVLLLYIYMKGRRFFMVVSKRGTRLCGPPYSKNLQ